MDRTTLAALAAFPEQLEAHYAALPREFTHWAPASWEGVPSEPFTALEQLCHVRDIEIDGYHVRLRRALEEEQPQLDSIDGFALARARNYGGADAARVSSSFRAARAETLRLLMTLSPAQLSRPAVFAEHGVVTVRALVHLLCSHDQQHLAGMQWLLGRIASRL
jgi:DinB superfamily